MNLLQFLSENTFNKMVTFGKKGCFKKAVFLFVILLQKWKRHLYFTKSIHHSQHSWQKFSLIQKKFRNQINCTSLYFTVRGDFCSPLGSLVINPFNKNLFILDYFYFESSFITNNSWKFEVTKASGSFSSLRFPKLTYKIWAFLITFNLNDFIKRFCDVTTLT